MLFLGNSVRRKIHGYRYECRVYSVASSHGMDSQSRYVSHVRSFQKTGFYKTPTGDIISESDFKGVYIAVQ